MHRPVCLKALAVGLCTILMSVTSIAAQTSTGTTDKMAGYSVEKKKEAVSCQQSYDKAVAGLKK